MCHDTDAAPPVASGPTAWTAGRRLLTSADGSTFRAYLARPTRGDVGVGVLVLPDNRGLTAFYEKLADRLAQEGYATLAIDYFGRCREPDRRDHADGLPGLGDLMRLTRAGLQDDLAAGAEFLRRSDGAGCAGVVALGFCLGGRLAFFAAAPRFELAGVIGFYGVPGVAGPYGPGPTQHAAELAAPILGLFGGADEGIPADAVVAFEAALTGAGVPHEIVTYPGAPHGFFDAAQGDHQEACADAWRRVLAFLRQRGK